MTVAIDTLHNFLRVELPGIPEPLLADGVRKSIQQFFKMSEVWRHTVPAPLLDWTEALTFPAIGAGAEIPTGTRLVRVDHVKYASDGKSLHQVPFRTRQQLDAEYEDWEVKIGNTPLRFTHDTFGDEPRIIPIATADVLTSLQVRAIITPDDTLVVLPNFLFFEFEDDFRNGTLARLMKIPGKDWTNFAAASGYASLFTAGWMKAKSRAKAEFGQPERMTSYGGIPGSSFSPNVNDYGRT